MGQGLGVRQEATLEGSLIQPPREIEQLLSQAKTLIQSESWSEATLAIGMVLGLESNAPGGNDFASQDYFTDVDPTPLTKGSVREAALKLLNDLPDAGAKVFELRYGAASQQTLNTAIAEGDWPAIEQLSRLYASTTAGREAMWLCAESKIGRGLPMDAAVILDQLMLQSRARDRFGVSGFVLSAACWKAANQTTFALESLTTARKFFPKASLEWRNKRLTMTTDVQILLDSISLGEYSATQRKETQPYWIGGLLDRNADTPAGVPLPLVNWIFPMHESDQLEAAAAKTVKQKSDDRNIAIIPSRVPIIVHPWVLMMTYDQRINAIHLKTGKVDWTGSFNRIPYDLSLDRMQNRDFNRENQAIPEYVARRIWGEAASGQLASDGRNVYSLTEMPSSDASESLRLGINANVFRPSGRKSFNVLQAWSVEAQGKLIWEVGGETGLSEPSFAGVLFLGPPVAHESELLILGELNGEVYLFSLAPTDGHLLWGQQLVANQVTLALDPIRRSMACSPSVAAGCAICPTLSGQLVAVDLGTRNLRWAHRYQLDHDAVSFNQFNAWGGNPFSESHPYRLRSVDSAALILDNCVVHAPSDSGTVYAVDLFDGRTLWEIPKSNSLYVGAGWNGRVLLVNDQALNCIDAQTGKNVWDKPTSLAHIGRVAGRGVRNGNRFFLPMTSQEILEIDFESGAIVDRMRVKEPLGNLVATADQLISLSPVDLTAYTIRDRLRAQIDLEFAQGENSAGAMQRRGKILLAEGKISEALDSVEAAYSKNRDDPEVKLLLGEIAMMALREDFSRFAPRISGFEELVSSGPEKSEYLTLLIDGLLRQAKHIEATKRLLELSDFNSEGSNYVSMVQETIEPEPQLLVRQEIWIAARLSQIYSGASVADRTVIEQLVQPKLTSLEKSRRTLDHYRRSDVFRWMPMASKLRIDDANAVFKEQESLLAEQTIEEVIDVAVNGLRKSDDPAEASPRRSSISETLAREADRLRFEIYNNAGRWTTSLAIANRLKQPLTDVRSQPAVPDSIRDGIHRLPSIEVPDINDFDRYLNGVKAWPSGKAKVEVIRAERPLQTEYSRPICTVKQRVGDALENWSVIVLPDLIELTSPSGRQRLSATLQIRPDGVSPPTAHFVDSIAIIETQGELIAMDTLRASEPDEIAVRAMLENIMWRIPLGRSSSETQLQNRNGGFGQQGRAFQPNMIEKPWGEMRPKNRKGFVVGPATRTGVVVATTINNSVFSLDPRTEGKRWIRTGIGALPTMVQDGFQLAILDRENTTRWIVDSRDGRLISKEKWEDDSEVWCSAGRNILSTYEKKNDGKRIVFKLWDAFTGETILERDFSKNMKADVCEQECLVAWESNGELSFWNLRTGKESTSQIDLPPKTALKRLALERFGESILVLTDSLQFQQEFVKLEDVDGHHKCRGPAIALDANDGHPLWKNPVVLNDYRFPVSQVRTTPGVMFTRLLKFKVDGYIAEAGSVAILDLRTGQLIYSNDYLDAIRGGIEFQSCVKMGQPELDLQYRGSELHVVWSDDSTAEKEPENEETKVIGKLDQTQLEKGAPKEWLERLQSGLQGDLFAPEKSIQQQLDAQRAR